jgi:hypothetical protein
MVIMFVPNRSGISAVHAVVPLACPGELVDELHVTLVAPVARPRNVMVGADVDVIVITG